MNKILNKSFDTLFIKEIKNAKAMIEVTTEHINYYTFSI